MKRVGEKVSHEGEGILRVIELEFDEYDNKDCEDRRYGCTCINYERCCGCLIQ